MLDEQDFEERVQSVFDSAFARVQTEYTPEKIEIRIRKAFESIIQNGIKKLLGLVWNEYTKDWRVEDTYGKNPPLRRKLEEIAKPKIEEIVNSINFDEISFSNSEIKGIQRSYKENLLYSINEEATTMAKERASTIVKDVLENKVLTKKKAQSLTDEEILEIAKKRNLIP